MAQGEDKSIKDLVDEIIADGKLTLAEKIRFEQAMMVNGKLDDSEKEQIKRIMNLLAEGKLIMDDGA